MNILEFEGLQIMKVAILGTTMLAFGLSMLSAQVFAEDSSIETLVSKTTAGVEGKEPRRYEELKTKITNDDSGYYVDHGDGLSKADQEARAKALKQGNEDRALLLKELLATIEEMAAAGNIRKISVLGEEPSAWAGGSEITYAEYEDEGPKRGMENRYTSLKVKTVKLRGNDKQ